MRFTPTPLPGAFLIGLEERRDDRGFFARSFCAREFAEHGLEPAVAQCNVSFNSRKGTLRGMHFQEPAAEAKLVRTTAGAIWDVIVDLRHGSPTYLRHFGVELDAAGRQALYVPKGFAHGFLTLADATEVFYQMSEFYAPGQDQGVRYDDPAFAIAWPIPVAVISDRDRGYPDFKP
jgi:dTDP-4-dehydrorhamnose 3,5-epimerase